MDKFIIEKAFYTPLQILYTRQNNTKEAATNLILLFGLSYFDDPCLI